MVNRDGASADISIISTNVADGSTAIVTADTSSITVTYDADTAELVFRDTAGRSLGFGYDASANGLANTGVGPLLEEYVTGRRTKIMMFAQVLLPLREM